MESHPSLDAFGLQLVPDSPQIVRIGVSKPGNTEEGKKSERAAPRWSGQTYATELPYSVGPPRVEVLW